jgi:hypothetical protein
MLFMGGGETEESGDLNMKKKVHSAAPAALAALLLCGVCLTACAGKVEGGTYSGNGGVRVEFKSGGKAYVTTGPVTMPCTYAESGGTVTLVCEGDKTLFTIDKDGALIGPQGGFLEHLSKDK